MTEPIDRDPVSSCEGKVRFEDRALADQTSQRSRAKHQQAIAPYKCEHCGFWHLGQHHAGKGFNNRAKKAQKLQGDHSWETGRCR